MQWTRQGFQPEPPESTGQVLYQMLSGHWGLNATLFPSLLSNSFTPSTPTFTITQHSLFQALYLILDT